MFNTKNKKLLVLGGGISSVDIVKNAKEAGIYTIVTDYYENGEAKKIADESLNISTVDYDKLVQVIKEKKIDGVFCGPSEFNIFNAIKISELADLPFYCTEEQWNICADKSTFKELCKQYNVPCVPDYEIDDNFKTEDLSKIEYPVMVKPADASSSRGICACFNEQELKKAYKEALTFSKRKKVIVEKYLQNNRAFAVRYLAYNGKIKMFLASDSYVVDPINRKALISNVSIYPSKLTDNYLKDINENVIKMFNHLGIKNGTMFMQALIDPDTNSIYFHEMGLRLSGGLTYTITSPLTGINDVMMQIRYMVGCEFSNDEEIAKIDPYLGGKVAVSLCMPLRVGKIAKIIGVKECLSNLDLLSYVQYYNEGDEITESKIGTLDQHLCRIKFIVTPDELVNVINYIQDSIIAVDDNNNSMLFMRFDTNRLSVNK